MQVILKAGKLQPLEKRIRVSPASAASFVWFNPNNKNYESDTFRKN
jgi:hypothetical protein